MHYGEEIDRRVLADAGLLMEKGSIIIDELFFPVHKHLSHVKVIIKNRTSARHEMEP